MSGCFTDDKVQYTVGNSLVGVPSSSSASGASLLSISSPQRFGRRMRVRSGSLLWCKGVAQGPEPLAAPAKTKRRVAY
jgi:hypothetical protein